MLLIIQLAKFLNMYWKFICDIIQLVKNSWSDLQSWYVQLFWWLTAPSGLVGWNIPWNWKKKWFGMDWLPPCQLVIWMEIKRTKKKMCAKMFNIGILNYFIIFFKDFLSGGHEVILI